MSKPLTEQQRRILDKCVPDDQNLSLAIVAVLDRLDFLEVKNTATEDVISALARAIGSLIAAGYDNIQE
jgi:S1-C subfamily serine protease